MYVCMYVRTYVRTYVCMYVCMYVHVYDCMYASRPYVIYVHRADMCIHAHARL